MTGIVIPCLTDSRFPEYRNHRFYQAEFKLYFVPIYPKKVIRSKSLYSVLQIPKVQSVPKAYTKS